MKLPDVNFLAGAASFQAHAPSSNASLAGGGERLRQYLFCRATQQAILRLLTTSAVFSPYGNAPLTNREAWDLYSQLKRDGRIAFAEEPDGVEATWETLATRDRSSPKIWMDAYLAAFAIRGEMRMVTFDHGFKSFEAQGLDLILLEP